MKVDILEEAGYSWAMRGLARSFKKPIHNMHRVAKGLADKDRGHNKWMRSIIVWLDIEAPLDFWKQFDTYAVGVTKQSDSTMHTLTKQHLTQQNFEIPIPESYLTYLNSCIDGNMPVDKLGKMLPQGFLQGRTVCLSYAVIRNIILQRRGHKLPEWNLFIEAMSSLKHYELLGV